MTTPKSSKISRADIILYEVPLKMNVKELTFSYVGCPIISSNMRQKTSIEAMQLIIVTISMKFLLD